MTRCPEEYRKQWRLVQGKSGWEKQKEEEAKEEAEQKREEKCYKLKLLGLDNKTTLVLNNTRELNRDLFTN